MFKRLCWERDYLCWYEEEASKEDAAILTICNIDVNECVQYAPCNPNADCTNTDGSYTCTCSGGFSGDGMACSGTSQY